MLKKNTNRVPVFVLILLMPITIRTFAKSTCFYHFDFKIDSLKKIATVIPAPRLQTDMYYVKPLYEKVDSVLKNSENLKQVKLLFIGNSITRNWESNGSRLWESYFNKPTSPYYTINLGISGDRTQHLLYRLLPKSQTNLGHVDHKLLNPKVIVLEIGTNNLWVDPVEDIVAGIRECAKKILILKPKAKLILISIPPVSDIGINKKVNLINNIISVNLGLSKVFARRITYLDINTGLKKLDGNIIEDHFIDGVHLSGKGYEFWFNKMRPKLDSLLKNVKSIKNLR